MSEKQFKIIPSQMGELIALTENQLLVGLYFRDQRDLPSLEGCIDSPNDTLLTELASRLEAYFAGEPVRFDFPLQPRGTIFQREAWQALREVPFGSSVSYGDLATAIQRPKAMRAVGQAVGANPWIIIVPCHRVLAAGGKPGGFSAGLERKKALLELEGIAINQ
jgi:methylated-DNA-[protein]-cysteine S-methyltransferase